MNIYSKTHEEHEQPKLEGSIVVDAEEAVGTFKGFSDKEQPAATKWLNEQFIEIETRAQHDKPI